MRHVITFCASVSRDSGLFCNSSGGGGGNGGSETIQQQERLILGSVIKHSKMSQFPATYMLQIY